MAHSTKSISHSDPQQLSELSRRMIAIYRGWDAYERSHAGPEIVDFDLTDVEASESFDSRWEVLAALKELHKDLNEEEQDGDFLRTRVQGSLAYLRLLIGQKIAFPEYVEQTLGVVPEFFAEEGIEAARQTVNELFAPFHVELKTADRKRFEKEFELHDPQKIRQGIVGDQALWLKRLSEAGIPVPEDLRLTVEFAEVDAYWSNWISGSLKKGITLAINLHERKRYYKGGPLSLCLHEICGHAVHMAIWRDRIASGKMNPACGLTVVHSPEAFQTEGLGQTVADLLDDGTNFPPEFRLNRAMLYYTQLVLHNAHLMIYKNVPVEEIFQYASERLPFTSQMSIESEIRDRSTNYLFRTYQLSYASGERTIRALIQNLGIEQKRKFFLEIYTQPLTPARLMQFGAEAVHL